MTTPLGLVFFAGGLALFILAVIVYRNCLRAYGRITATMVEQALSPCPHRPIDAIPCARPAGHHGPHLVRPSDVIRAGFHPAPF